MPKRIPPLTDKQCKAHAYNPNGGNDLFDGGGLYLRATPAGSKLWHLAYRLAGKERTLSIGPYPEVGLPAARQARDEAKSLVREGKDPVQVRRSAKAQAAVAAKNTFGAVSQQWFDVARQGWKSASHAEKTRSRIDRFLLPALASRPIGDITKDEIRAVIDKALISGTETAHRVLSIAHDVFAFAQANDYTANDPTIGLRKAMPKRSQKSFATVTEPRRVGEILRILYGCGGRVSPQVLAALKLAPLLFVRPGELQKAEWAHIDLDRARWQLPAKKMKMSIDHIVPLPTQAVVILRELHMLTGRGKFVFQGLRGGDTSISEATLLAAMRRMDIPKEELVTHGFRHMAMTLLKGMGFNREHVDRQLAHQQQGSEAKYDFATFLPERIKMMQAWADYLDGLRTGADVIPINRTA